MADARRPVTAGSEHPLASTYDVALLDLDGVVYVGADAVPNAADALRQARGLGMRLAFVTNNAARTPATVAAHLTELGIDATPGEVVTSAQAAAHHLADRLPPGSHVLVVGTVGLDEALAERGLQPVAEADEQVAAVVQGFSPTMNWSLLAEGSIAIGRGVPWVATNVDPTVPSQRGPLPGNGSMVAALRHATGATPLVTGKPDPTMHRESVERSGARRPLVVGDRLDTDIEGANAAGCDSLLVLSGVTSAADLLAAGPRHRPTYVGADLRSLLTPHASTRFDGTRCECAGWTARAAGLQVQLAATGNPRRGVAGQLDALRALCGAVWQARDADADSDADSDADNTAGLGCGPDAVREARYLLDAADPESAAALVALGLSTAKAPA